MRNILFLAIPGLFAFIQVFYRPHENEKQRMAQLSSTPSGDTLKEVGKRVFFANCYACHKDSSTTLAPAQTVLSVMTPRAIYAALNNGKMRQQGAALTDNERKGVAIWLTNKELKETSFSRQAFTNFSLANYQRKKSDHSGWGNNLASTGYRNGTVAGINKENLNSLKLKWAFAFPEATVIRSKPAVVGDWIIVGGQYGELLAINKNSGKLGWTFNATSAIRGGIAVTYELNAITAFFADYSSNVYAVDVKTGKQIWTKRAGFDQQSSVTGTVVPFGGKLFVPISSLEVGSAANGKYECCFSSGGVVALNAKTGDIVWNYRVVPGPAKVSGKKKNGKPIYGPSGGPVWCSPTVDAQRGLLYIGTGENYSLPTTNGTDAVQAINVNTGKLVWTFQATSGDAYNVSCPFFENCPEKPGPDLDFGMAPMIITRKDGKEILVAGQKSGVVFALTPEGKLIWKTRIGKGGMLGGVHWGMATDGKYAYGCNADNAIAIDKRDSSISASPGVFALDLMNGNVIWKTPTPDCGFKNCLLANSAAPLAIPGLVFAGALDGHIRAYSSSDGKILWDYPTAKEFETSDGIPGRGGAIDGPAPVVADGMLFVNSGYGMFGQMPGNVLLAFEVGKGK
ncbi:MAG: dehydrogenase [Bacteroidetes bacterium]|nr:MAG: dehydrogenase [Bacteroidota bacterium]